MTMRPLFLCLFLSLMLGSYAQVNARLLSPMPDQGRDDAVGFAIDGVGYIVGGRKTDFGISNDLWAYDPGTDEWSLRNPFPGNPRQYASSFVLDGWAYIFCGLADPGLRLNELWRYNPANDIWEQRSPFPGGARFAPISFVLDGTAYAGLGKGNDVYYDDLWSYQPLSDTWELEAQLPIAAYSAITFKLENEVVIGLGLDDQEAYNARIWSFDGSRIIERNTAPLGLGFADAVNLGTQAIVIGGRTESAEARDGLFIANNVLTLNQPKRVEWEAQAPIVDGAKRNGAVFQIGDKGYYFGGKDEQGLKTNALVEFSIEPIKNAISVYPNPSSDALRVQSPNAFRQLRIYDMQDRLLLNNAQLDLVFELRLDISGLASGLYYLQVDDSAAQQIVVLD